MAGTVPRGSTEDSAIVDDTAAAAGRKTGQRTAGRGGARWSGKDVACKLVAWFPRQAQATRAGTLVARSASEKLLIALNEKDEKLWVYNGDQLPRWAAEHRDQLQRWSEDQKAEHRPDPPFAERRSHAAAKYNQRMASACHPIAAMLVGYAERRRFAAIRWDDSDQSFAPQFPWFRLRELIREKADQLGIAFEQIPSSPVPKETPRLLADDKKVE